LFRLAFAEDALVGYLLVYPYDSDQGRMVNIARLMIDHRFQGRGFGRQLLETALKWIATFEPAVDIVRISTLPGNIPALSLYESADFTRKGMENGEVALYLEVN
jgi:diamine N-acetyltransferase